MIIYQSIGMMKFIYLNMKMEILIKNTGEMRLDKLVF